MDKYIVDLDQMLDDLEAAESTSTSNVVTSETPSLTPQETATSSISSLSSNGLSSLGFVVGKTQVIQPETPLDSHPVEKKDEVSGNVVIHDKSNNQAVPLKHPTSEVTESLLDTPVPDSDPDEQPFSLSPTLVPVKARNEGDRSQDKKSVLAEKTQVIQNQEEASSKHEHELKISLNQQQDKPEENVQQQTQSKQFTLQEEAVDKKSGDVNTTFVDVSTSSIKDSHLENFQDSCQLQESLQEQLKSNPSLAEEMNGMVSVVSPVKSPMSVQAIRDRMALKNSKPTDEELLQDVLKDVEEFERNRSMNGDIDLSAEGFEFDEQDLEFDYDLNAILKAINKSQLANRRFSRDEEEEEAVSLEKELQDAISSANSSASSSSHRQTDMKDKHVSLQDHLDDDDSCLQVYSKTRSTVNGEAATFEGDHNHDAGPSSSSILRFSDCHIDSDEMSEEHMSKYLADVTPQDFDSLESVPEPATTTIPVKAVRPSTLNIPVVASEATAESTSSENIEETPNEFQSQEQERQEGEEVMMPPTESIDSSVRVGHYKPFWIPDHEAPVCMHCDTRFTVIKRRHHCRACGKVLCASCCNMKAQLAYMEWKEARVCSICHRLITESEEYEHHLRQTQEEGDADSSPSGTTPTSPQRHSGNNDTTGTDQALLGATSSAVIPVGVLKKADRPKGEPKQVVFSDGVRPGGESTEAVTQSDASSPASSSSLSSSPSVSSSAANIRKHLMRLRSPPVEVNPLQHQKLQKSSEHRHRHKVVRTIIEDPYASSSGQSLPAVINCPPELEFNPSLENLMSHLESESDATPVTFYLSKNLHVMLKITRLTCCSNVQVWSFASKGLATVGQDEVAVVLERMEGEDNIPRDVFRLISSMYDSSCRGVVYSEMSHVLFHDGVFGSKDYSGFLFIRPTVQCLSKIILPSTPFLISLLIQRTEVPWASVFPLRLVLRLGAEFSCYPCPIVSYRQRKACFNEVGHTILNVLVDFRNFQYKIHVAQGVMIRRKSRDKKVILSIPRNRYESVIKILNQSNEHVLALGGNLDLTCQAHFACIQNEDGRYQTLVVSPLNQDQVAQDNQEPEIKEQNQDITIEDTTVDHSKTEDTKSEDLKTDSKDLTEGILTGTSFIAFSGSLKTTTGFTAKMNIVEDGIRVEIPANVMSDLKTALKEMKDFEIRCSKIGHEEETDEKVCVEWGPDDTYFNVGVRSPIDGKSLEGVPSVRVHNSTDYASGKFLIRWTEVFFLENKDNIGRRDIIDPTKAAGIISQSLCRALTPHLDQLFTQGLTKIGLRVSLDPEQVGYEVGSRGQPLPPLFVSELDSALIPVITGSFLSNLDALLVLELFFHIIFK